MEKEKFLKQFLKNVPFEGWNKVCIENTSQQVFNNKYYVYTFFPHGESEIISFFKDYLDQRMTQYLIINPLKEEKINTKIKKLILIRLEIYTEHKMAIKKLFSASFLPSNAAQAAKSLWQISDNFWKIIHDKSTDYNWYTKRLILSCIFFRTLLYWLNDSSENNINTELFLTNQIEKFLLFGKLKNKISNIKISNLPFIRLLNKKSIN